MPELQPDGFAEFFEAVRGHEPFPWQADLADRLIQSRFPDVIDVPTGLGKTSVIDCWAFALAVHASRERRGVPLRLCFVVDRRLVVDATYDDALALANALANATGTPGMVGRVSRALRSLHGGDHAELEVVRMRGGVTWESRWLARPDRAAVVVGTVDQFGSRVLFRGYGVSPSMWPINAALVGVDSWLVVDEAHIAEPLVQTVGRVRAHQQLQKLTCGRGLLATRMSATVDGSGEVLRADPDEQTTSKRFPNAGKEAAKRLNVSKPVALLDLGHLAGSAGKSWGGKARQLGEAMAAIARKAGDDATVVGVVANTIATARAAHRDLVSKGENAILLIGRVRGYERDRILEEWLPKIRVGAPRDMPRRLFVVATQTIEVGANLDLDALVTECAPLSALVQRFGRVNRVGDHPVHDSAIVHAGFAHDEDPIYGEATSSTWVMLRERGKARTVDNTALERAWPDPSLDFGLQSVRNLVRDAPAGVHPPVPFVPVALGAHIERWTATNPAPLPDQPVAPFLHGSDRGTPEVSIAWRAQPPAEPDTAPAWQRWLDLVPPVEWEFVSVPVWLARIFLAGVGPEPPLSDLEGTVEPQAADTDFASGEQLLGVVYRGPRGEASPVRGPADIAPGDRLVLRSDIGGHDRWGWTGRRSAPGDAPIPDVGDLAPTRRRGVLRLSRAVFDTWMRDDEVLGRAFVDLNPNGSANVAVTLQALSKAALPVPLNALIRKASNWRPYAMGLSEGSTPVVVLTGPPAAIGRGEDTASDDDEASTSQTSAQVSIGRHGGQVADTARRFAENLSLPGKIVRAVELAGRWHDLGKADIRFQLMLHDGDELSATTAAEPLAKSGRDSRDPLARRARQLAGLPTGFRHEAVSARLFDELAAAKPALLEEVDPELVRHLVVSHHGYARPLLPALLDAAAPQTRAQAEGLEVVVDGLPAQVDWAQPARFKALNERYGWWGLALLECIVRLADMWCSERGE